MKLTGPDAVPPPASSSLDDRIGERLVPVPDPNLNSMPSVLASVMIESIVSWTELMKQAEHCGAYSKPQLNQTGVVKAPVCDARIGLTSTPRGRLAGQPPLIIPAAFTIAANLADPRN